MAKAYSEDLRHKVIAHIMSGSSKREAARIFNIGEDTVYRWLRLYKVGNINATKRTVFPQKMNEEKLKEYVRNNPDHTITQIAHALQLGRQTVFSWLRRLKITRKKRQPSIKSVMKTSAVRLRSD